MTDSLARLRASKEKSAVQDHANGVKAGRLWATETAEWDEAVAVSALAEDDSNFDGLHKLLHDLGLGYDHEEVMQLLGRGGEGDIPVSDELVEGFVEGVGQVLAEA